MAIADREKTKGHGCVSIFYELFFFFEPDNLQFEQKKKILYLVIAFWS